MSAHLTEFPPEFKKLLADSQPVHDLGHLTIVPGEGTPPDDPALVELAENRGVWLITARSWINLPN